MYKLEGKVAIVTGADCGIGAAIAVELVKAGLTVVGLAKRKDKVEVLRTSLAGAPGELCAFECDVTHEHSVKAAYAWLEKKFEVDEEKGLENRIKFLINNASAFSNYLFLEENNTRDLKTVIDTNLTGLYLCTREFVRVMKEREESGTIINVNSVFGHITNSCVPGTRPVNGMYPAPKHAITSITDSLRQELSFNESDIRISNISPGLTENDILSETKNDLVKLMPRLKAEDVAQVVIYILSQPDHVEVHDVVIKPKGEYL